MSMDIKAQAELRRRRILANAEARLNKITGKENVDISKVPEEAVVSESSNGHTHKGSCIVSEPEDRPTMENFDIPNLTEEGINNRINELNVEYSAGAYNLTSKQDYLLLKLQWFFYLSFGVLIRILIYWGFSWVFLDNVFGAFLVACIPGLPGLYKIGDQPTGLLNFVFLAGRHQGKLQILIKIIRVSRVLAQFFALYLFAFILTDLIIQEQEAQ